MTSHQILSVESFVNWAMAAAVMRDCNMTLTVNTSDCLFLHRKLGFLLTLPFNNF